MCGIVGLLRLRNDSRTVEALRAQISGMTTTLVHRGPDDAGVWIDEQVGVALGFRRLAIVDLSPAGHQPMTSVAGRYTIVFNGEVYNHRQLRAQLQDASHTFRGHSDTEVLLAGIEKWGFAETLRKAVGMFAIALWDARERTLSLARDRMGERPLYYGRAGNDFVFGSELKALMAHPTWHGEIDSDALQLYMRHGYVPAPYTIFRGIQKLQPGTFITITAANAGAAKPQDYWSLQDVAVAGNECRHELSPQAAVDELDRLLKQAIELQMVADVPVGAFLSGGVDSSTVVALMQAIGTRPVRTFSIGFHESIFNEAHHAADVARHLGTQHTELYVSPGETQQVIPLLPTVYDEPFADGSQIPTWLVAKLAREHVTVSLSGDGGDELFAGYPRYALVERWWRRFQWLPNIARRPGSFAALRAAKIANRLLSGGKHADGPSRMTGLNSKLHRLSSLVMQTEFESFYRDLISYWTPRDKVCSDSHDAASLLTDRSCWPAGQSLEERLMYLDQRSYLPDDILVKVDRAGMAHSLETRVPLLDHRIVEFAWRLNAQHRTQGGMTKWVLRQVLDKYVPRKLIDRPKMGFGVPIGIWLRGPLREWAEELLSPQAMEAHGLLNSKVIRSRWKDHLSGGTNWQHHLWVVLMFQAWHGSVKSQIATQQSARNGDDPYHNIKWVPWRPQAA